MICIFSSAADYSTTEVIRWLHYLGRKDVIRVNYMDAYNKHTIHFDIQEGDFSFEIDGKLYRLKDIEAVWYRKGINWLCDQFYAVTINERKGFTNYLNNKLKQEESTLAEYLHYVIEHTVPVLGSPAKGDLNKLLVLAAAKQVGLLIPSFYISNYKEGVQRIFEHSKGLITKSISDCLFMFDNKETNTSYISYTEKVSKETTDCLPETFSPSLLQECITKKFECRVFFLEDTCYSMAILSQADDQTKVDFRKYNEEKPNRCVPFILPADIDEKIKLLFKKTGLNTGSVDLMIDENDNYYFLEINPVGQYAMVSEPCNYFLDKAIALKLIDYAGTKRAG